MSKTDLPNLSFEERGKLAARVKELRTTAGMKQSELAELAGITRQALSNIERGSVPQIDNLRRIYEVLGIEITPFEFSTETRQWLAIVGGILDSLPETRRAEAGRAAVATVTEHLQVAARSNVIVGGFGENASADEDEIPDNVEAVWAEDFAASPKSDLPEDHTP
ncbi:helix-turn-helix transcriptional regulator [Leucobacter sp. NPDC058333]|uniref:helix-turn-helix transcriptional regulator n=1 Tax=Leucobacter sp. NPDC058333 TaxID=3346450 RepID=UPI00365B5A8A